MPNHSFGILESLSTNTSLLSDIFLKSIHLPFLTPESLREFSFIYLKVNVTQLSVRISQISFEVARLTLMDHPPDCSDLAPSDFFPSFQEAFARNIIPTQREIGGCCGKFLSQMPHRFFQRHVY
jgi:hypothetical protein